MPGAGARSLPMSIFRTDDNLALQRLVAAGYCHAFLDRLGASGAVEPSLTWLEPEETLIPAESRCATPATGIRARPPSR